MVKRDCHDKGMMNHCLTSKMFDVDRCAFLPQGSIVVVQKLRSNLNKRKGD